MEADKENQPPHPSEDGAHHGLPPSASGQTVLLWSKQEEDGTVLQRHVSTVTDMASRVSGYLMHDTRVAPDGTWQLWMHKAVDWLAAEHIEQGRAEVQDATIRALVAMATGVELAQDLAVVTAAGTRTSTAASKRKTSPFKHQIRVQDELLRRSPDGDHELSPSAQDFLRDLIVSPPASARRRLSMK